MRGHRDTMTDTVPAVSTEVYAGHLVDMALQQLLGRGLARSRE